MAASSHASITLWLHTGVALAKLVRIRCKGSSSDCDCTDNGLNTPARGFARPNCDDDEGCNLGPTQSYVLEPRRVLSGLTYVSNRGMFAPRQHLRDGNTAGRRM